MKWRLANGKVVLENSIEENSSIIIDGSKILNIMSANSGTLGRSDNYDKTIDVSGCYILPGFIDLHCHGGRGADVMDSSPDALDTIGRFHASGGTAYFLATTASDSLKNMVDVLETVRSVKGDLNSGAKILGVHLEGPYFSFSKHGCHLPEFVRNPSESETEVILHYKDIIRSITMAPEIPGAADAIKRFTENNIVASLGHTACSYNEAIKAIDAGARHVTHLYCAMSGIVKNGIERSGGMIETALLEDRLTCEIIADGIHLPEELIRLAVKIKSPEKICVVTDAMRGAGMQDGIYTFGSLRGQEAVTTGKIAVVKDKGGLASSLFKMNEMFRHLRENMNFSYTDLAKMFSLTPARILSMEEKLGSIKPGKAASFTILDSNHEVKATIVDGNVVYLRE